MVVFIGKALEVHSNKKQNKKTHTIVELCRLLGEMVMAHRQIGQIARIVQLRN